MDLILYIVAIVFFVQSKKYKDQYGNYTPEGQSKRKIALICLIIGIVLSLIGFVGGFIPAFVQSFNAAAGY